VTAKPVLRVEDLHVDFHTRRGLVRAVQGVSLAIEAGKTLCIVGESGSGKSTMALGLVGLLPGNAQTSGRVRLEGDDILGTSEMQLEDVRGRRVGVVFQDAARALNPVLTIGRQIAEVLQRHLNVSAHTALARAVELLTEVGVNDPVARIKQYPHQLSGGLKQRVMIAIAIACEPALVIADEPTTALDVSVQGQVLRLLRRLCTERRLALMLVTHDFGVVAAVADDVAVMYAGRIIEYADAVRMFQAPEHPYTRALLAATPRIALNEDGERAKIEPIPGSPPDPLLQPGGCSFAPRCVDRFEHCVERPPLRDGPAGDRAACWLVGAHDG
jgi:oligopeptide/dipeptide ABC transporter ATP-binding protein